MANILNEDHISEASHEENNKFSIQQCVIIDIITKINKEKD